MKCNRMNTIAFPILILTLQSLQGTGFLIQHHKTKQQLLQPNRHQFITNHQQSLSHPRRITSNSNKINTRRYETSSPPGGGDGDFSFGQRIESVKSAVVGAVSGGVCLAPLSALHDIYFGGDAVSNGVAQWEFDTDMGSLEAALFAIVYRYAVRKDINPMLNQGVIGAFAFVRILSKIQVPTICIPAPLDCGSPLGYFNWEMLTQAGLSGIESLALFGGAAAAMDYCFSRKIISKFG